MNPYGIFSQCGDSKKKKIWYYLEIWVLGRKGRERVNKGGANKNADIDVEKLLGACCVVKLDNVICI